MVTTPTKDFRLAISEDIHAALEARAAARGCDMQTVAREVLQDWAEREAHAYRVYARRVIANGAQTELPGFEAESAGTPRGGRR